MIKVGALWAKTKDNKKFLSGKFGDATMLIFQNNYKTDERHPDYVVYLAENKPNKDLNNRDVVKTITNEEIPF